MPQNSSKQKFYFNVFVNIFQRYSWHKGSRMSRLCKRLGDIIQNKITLYFLMIFCVAKRQQMVEIFNKQTEQV
jgi:hypothetical protein